MKISPREDLFEDGVDPLTYNQGTLYKVVAPIEAGKKQHDNKHFALILVDEHDYAMLIDWNWGRWRKFKLAQASPTVQHDLFKIEQEVWEWLKEWELVELRAIGPEDSEYFATDKLTGKEG